MLAIYLGYKYIDTGAIYRTVALCALEEGIPVSDAEALAQLCRRIDIDLQLLDQVLKVYCNGRDVSVDIRGPEIGMDASTISAHPQVREALLALQRRLAGEKGAVVEGRDAGSVLFPDADMKFYLDASPEDRGKRRYIQNKGSQGKLKLEQIMDEIRKRDAQDQSRPVSPLQIPHGAIELDKYYLIQQAVSPLQIPHGAILIDNTDMSVEETVQEILSLLRKRFPDIVHSRNQNINL